MLNPTSQPDPRFTCASPINSGPQTFVLRSAVAALGTTVPLTDEQLRALYGSHGGFVRAWRQATHSALAAGFLRSEDAQDILVVGARSDILR